MRLVLAFAFALALLAGEAAGAESTHSVPHPSLWTVHGKHGTVYLLGSVHLLSPTQVWRDAQLEDVIHGTDTFLFETNIDQNIIKQYIADKGSLPAGQSLRAMLPAASQQDFDADLASIALPEANVDMRRPWLTSVAMAAIKATKSGGSPYAGVDFSILSEAQARGKPIRYLETIDQQLAFLVPADPKVELESFEVFLKSFRTEDDDLGPFTAAWLAGDQDRLGALMLKELGQHPDLRKAMLDDRNHAWLKEIEQIADSESGTFLITVGAAHMLGKAGLPALLRHDGYAVDGP